jgi:multidrug efflux pump subunit AcrA (membrane-fusion protein)
MSKTIIKWKLMLTIIGIGEMNDEHPRRLATLAIFVLLAALLVSCGSKGEKQREASSGSPVKVISPSVRTMIDNIELSGNTVFLKREDVRAPFQGYIRQTFKNIGDNVRAGDVLLLLQTKEAHAMGGTVRDSTANSRSVPVKAQSNGVLTHLFFHSGDYVSDGDQIAVVVDPRSLTVQLEVPFQASAQVPFGSGCTVLLPDGRTITGTVSHILPSVDPSSQTQTYLINCGEIGYLPENLNLSVQIPVKTVPNAVVVPKACVLSNETLDQFWVMKIVSDSTAERVDITKGIENDSLVQILNPLLTRNDKIISQGGYGLPDTASVTIEP